MCDASKDKYIRKRQTGYKETWSGGTYNSTACSVTFTPIYHETPADWMDVLDAKICEYQQWLQKKGE